MDRRLSDDLQVVPDSSATDAFERHSGNNVRPVDGSPEEPNGSVPAGTTSGSAPVAEIDDAEAATRLADLNKLLDLMRPAVQADGGDLVLVSADVRAGVIEVQLEGACSSCAISSTTLEAGVVRLLTQRLAWVTEVRGGVKDTDDWDASAAMGKGSWVAAEN